MGEDAAIKLYQQAARVDGLVGDGSQTNIKLGRTAQIKHQSCGD